MGRNWRPKKVVRCPKCHWKANRAAIGYCPKCGHWSTRFVTAEELEMRHELEAYRAEEMKRADTD